ncbi:MAG TPA: FGGY family carbohydrate kinase, partial [Candidatus Nitrosotenuis sp.]|nr:FGGY family carbohydrate kinase [Candidatus Nitrosotenuis sp.]
MYSLGIDVGSSAVKACLYRVAPGAAPEELARAAAFRPLRVPRPGWVEQDADEVVAAVLEVLASVLEQAGQPRPLVLGLATAMHSLLVLDRQGRPTGPALTWADQRSARQAERLRTLFPGPSLAVRTGTPLAAMAWPARLLWLKEQAPYLLDPSHRLASLKEYVVSRLAGLPPGRNFMDLSSASATGMYNILEGSWDGELLQLVGLSAEQLPEVLPTTFILPASGLGALLPPDSRLVLGGGDGPLSNLGVGALGPEVAALSLGTSGALRVARRGPARQGQGGTFCYHLVEEIWVVGGALSNGGVVLEWLGRGLGLSLEALLEEAAAVPWGAGGVVALPYLAGERTPHW